MLFLPILFLMLQTHSLFCSISSLSPSNGANTTGGASAFNQSLYVVPTPVVQVQFPYFIDPDYVVTGGTGITGLSTSGSGTVTQGTGMAQIRTGTTANSAALIASKDRVMCNPGEGLMVEFSSIFNAGVANNIQIIGVGNAADGFFFGYNGTSFGILYRSSISGSKIDTWTNQASWNIDPLNGTGPSGLTLTPTLGNVYRIEYSSLGFGVVDFSIANPNNGTFVLVHRIKFLNSVAAPMVSNSSMQLLAMTYNISSGTSNVNLRTSSMAGFVQGQLSVREFNRYSVSVSDSFAGGSSNALRPVLTILNNSNYPITSSNVNQMTVYPDMLTLYNNSTQPTTFYLIVNPSIVQPSGTINVPVIGCIVTTSSAYSFPLIFTGINSNSVVSYASSTGATLTACLNNLTTGNYVTPNSGAIIYSCTIAPTQDGYVLNLSDLGIILTPNDALSLVAQRTGTTATTVYASLSWTERY